MERSSLMEDDALRLLETAQQKWQRDPAFGVAMAGVHVLEVSHASWSASLDQGEIEPAASATGAMALVIGRSLDVQLWTELSAVLWSEFLPSSTEQAR